MLNEYSTCIRSMRFRYLKRIFIIGKEEKNKSKLLYNLYVRSSMVANIIEKSIR